jgi:hypothetical protein
MSRLRRQLAVMSPSALQVSVGAGMLRVWDPQKGLVLELPAVVALQSESREPVAWFEEAAALEGKSPQGIECLRPWWGDEIVDRAALRELLSKFRQEVHAISGSQAMKAGSVTPLMMKWRVAPSVKELHRSWLERTLAEAGWWWPSVQRANYSDLTQVAAQTVIWDWGVSALRWSVWVGDTLVSARAFPELGLSPIVEGLVEAERSITGRQFSRAALMDLLWTVRHPAFDQKDQQPVFEPLSKTTLQRVQGEWLEVMARAWREFQQSIPAETAAQLAVSQSLVIGGGATIKPWIDLASGVTKVEWKAAKDPLYAEVRGSTF